MRRTINNGLDQPGKREESITLLSHLTNIEKHSGDTLMTNEPHRYISYFDILTVTEWEQRYVDDIARKYSKIQSFFRSLLIFHIMIGTIPNFDCKLKWQIANSAVQRNLISDCEAAATLWIVCSTV